MHKLLLTSPQIGSYSACLLAAMLGGYLLCRWQAVRAGIQGRHIDNLALLISILSLFGARLFSWLFYYPPHTNLWRALWDPSGGMVFYGGMIFGILAVLIYAGISRLELGNLFDTFASGLALGLAIGRVGCFMAGCCWGDVCVNPGELSNATGTALDWQIRTVPAISSAGFPLAVRFPAGAGAFEQHVRLGLIDEQAERSFPVHPVQLYESALALTLCGFLVRCFRRRRWRGQIVCLFLLGYSGIRFGTEFLRADNRPIYLGLTLSQMISVVSAGFALLVWLSREKSAAILRAKQPEPIPPAISAPASSRSAGS